MRDQWLPAIWGERQGGLDPFRTFRTQMDDLFRDFAGELSRPGAIMGGPEGMMSLRVDVCETPDELTVKADLPGVDQKDIDINVNGDQLTIKAEKRFEREEGDGEAQPAEAGGEKREKIAKEKGEKGEQPEKQRRVWHRTERAYGMFQRTMTVPFNIDPDSVSASFKDGVLTVTVPKPPEVQKQSKRIEVKS